MGKKEKGEKKKGKSSKTRRLALLTINKSWPELRPEEENKKKK